MDYNTKIDIGKQKKLIKEFSTKFSEKLELRNKVENNFELENRLDEIIRELDIHGKFFSLFHELNYQRVVDNLNKQLLLWKAGIGILVVVGCLGLYFVAYFEPFVPLKINDEYRVLIETIENSVYFKDEDLKSKLDGSILANLTSTYFNIYFARYLILRVFIAAIYLTIVTFTLRVYNRIRRNKMIMIHKEEATTTTLFLLEKIADTPEKLRLLNLIIPELYKLDYIENPKKKKDESDSTRGTSREVSNLIEDRAAEITNRIFNIIETRLNVVLPGKEKPG